MGAVSLKIMYNSITLSLFIDNKNLTTRKCIIATTALSYIRVACDYNVTYLLSDALRL